MLEVGGLTLTFTSACDCVSFLFPEEFAEGDEEMMRPTLEPKVGPAMRVLELEADDGVLPLERTAGWEAGARLKSREAGSRRAFVLDCP